MGRGWLVCVGGGGGGAHMMSHLKVVKCLKSVKYGQSERTPNNSYFLSFNLIFKISDTHSHV